MPASSDKKIQGNCHPSDRDAIVGILQAQAEAWGRGDAEGYAASAESDLSFTNIRGQRWIGRSEFVRIHQSIFSSAYAGSTLGLEIEQISCPGSDVAVAEALLVLTGAAAMPAGVSASSDGVLRTRLLEVFERREGHWVLVTYHDTVVVGT